MKAKLFILIFLQLNFYFIAQSQKFCFDCSNDSILHLIQNARNPKDSLFAIAAILDNNEITNVDLLDVQVKSKQLMNLNKRLNLINIKPYQLILEACSLWQKNEKEKSIEKLKQAISECDKDKVIFGIISWLGSIRVLYNSAGLQKEKLAYFQEKLSYYLENGPIENTAICYHGIAGYYSRIADYNKAISYYLKAAEIFQQFSLLAYSNEMTAIGMYYYSWGNFEKAKLYLEKGFELNVKTKLWTTAILAKEELALIDKKNNDYNGALNKINEALKINKMYDSEVSYINIISLAEKGGILLELNCLDEAFSELNKAEKLFDSISMPVITNLGNYEGKYYLYKYYKAIHNDVLAEKQLMLTYFNAIKSNSIELIIKYRKELAEFYLEKGKTKKALLYALSYIVSNDSLNDIQKSHNIAQYETEIKDKENIVLKTTNDFLRIKDKQQRLIILSAISAFLMMISISLLIARSLKHKKKTNKILTGLNEQLVTANNAIEKSHNIIKSDIQQAADYVFSLLPEKLNLGIIKTDWIYIPSSVLGGDAFGYHWIDNTHFAMYIIDVCGHGIGSALHSISVLNMLKSSLQFNVDTRDPEKVVSSLNESFLTEAHHGLFFTMWYGVYNCDKKTLCYVCAGHPAPMMTVGNEFFVYLDPPNLAVGCCSGYCYHSKTIEIKDNTHLLLFSDGVFEIKKADGQSMGLDEFYFLSRNSNISDIHRKLIEIQSSKSFDDDFSILDILIEQ